VLRRAISLGSLWDLAGRGKIVFNGLVGVTDEGYMAISSEGFTSGGGRSWRVKNVAAVIESGGKTRVKAFQVHIFPEGTQLLFPIKQPVQLNQAVRLAADCAILLRQYLAVGEWFITEGQSNTFRYAQLNWQMPEDALLEFPTEHKESLAKIWVGENEDGVLWSFRPEAEVTEEEQEGVKMRKSITERAIFKSHTKEEVKEACLKGMKVYELDTGNDGEDDILVGYNDQDVLIDVFNHFEFEELPDHWAIRELREDELEELGII